jgi:hypothetical protein
MKGAVFGAALAATCAGSSMAQNVSGTFSAALSQSVLTNHYLDAAGDSRTHESNSFYLLYSPPTTFDNWANFGSGYAGWLYPMSGNAYIPHLSWNYGVGEQTTAGLVARVNSNRTDCNESNASSTQPCFTGVRATTSGSTASGSSTIVLSGTSTGVTTGTYVLGEEPAVTAGADVTKVSVGASTTTVTLSIPTTSLIPSGTTVIFSPASASNPYWNYVPAGSDGSPTDGSNNISNFGTYSLCSDPAKVAYVLIGTNDALVSTSPTQSLPNIVSTLHALGPSGCNKIVILADELPRGLAEGTAWGGYELHTISNGSTTVTNASLYYDTAGVCYVPTTSVPGSGQPFTPGTNDGVCLTKVASSPAQGQYSVSSGGVYTFNSADNGARVGIYYRWKSYAVPIGTGGSNYLTTIHDFIDSTQCGSFTDPISGATFPYSGIKCPGKYPWVHVASTWAQWVDPTTGINNYPLPYVATDGLHSSSYGGRLAATAMLAAAPAGAIPSKAPFPLPTLNNAAFSGQVSSSTSTETTSCTGITGTQVKNFVSNLSPAASTGVYGVAGTISAGNGYGLLWLVSQTVGIPAGSVVDCVDTAHNLLHLKTASASASASGMAMMLQTDTTSFLPNGLFNHNEYSTSANAQCAGHCGTAGGNGTLSDATVTSGSNIVTAPTSISSPAVSGVLYPSATLSDSGSCIRAGTRVRSAYQNAAGGAWTLVMSVNATGNCPSDTITATGPTVVQGVSTGWTMTLANVTWGSDTMGVSYGVVTNPDGDGYDAFDLVLQGKTSGSPPSVLLQNTLLYATSQIQAAIGPTDSHRTLCKVQLFPGPNGHLWGVQDAALKTADETTGVFTAPGMTGVPNSPANTYKTYATIAGTSNASFEFNDADISAGPVVIPELTSPTNVGEPSTMTVAPVETVVVASTGSDDPTGGPISAVLRLKQCWAGKVTQ